MAKHVSKRRKTRRSAESGEFSEYTMRHVGKVRRRKGGPTKMQIETEPTLEVVRKNNVRFGVASAFAKLVRHTFEPLTNGMQDYRYSRRLQAVFTEGIRVAGSSEKADLFPCLTEFKSFAVNENPKLLRADHIQTSYTEEEGLCVRVRVDNRINKEQRNRFFIVSGAISDIDPVSKKSSALTTAATNYISLFEYRVGEVELKFPVRIERYCFLCVSIRCYEIINKRYEALSDQAITGAWLWLLDRERMLM